MLAITVIFAFVALNKIKDLLGCQTFCLAILNAVKNLYLIDKDRFFFAQSMTKEDFGAQLVQGFEKKEWKMAGAFKKALAP